MAKKNANSKSAAKPPKTKKDANSAAVPIQKEADPAKPTSTPEPISTPEAVADQWRNRIVGNGTEDPKVLLATRHEMNWHEHPPSQRERMRGILSRLGWIDEVIVNVNTKHMINGHMRVEEAVETGQPTVPVRYVDLTEEEELEALATFDTIGLLARTNAQTLRKLRDMASNNLEAIAEIGDESAATVKSVIDQAPMLNQTLQKSLRMRELRDRQAEKEAEESKHSLEGAPEDLPGALSLKEDMLFEMGAAPYDIPPLRADMLLDPPEPLVCWTAPDSTPTTTDDGRELWYLTVVGNGNLRGMPWQRTILCTHTNDDVLDRMWEFPKTPTAQLLNRGAYGAITPEYSIGTGSPKAFRVWNAYRNRWFGRYWQEAGIKVIPSVSHIQFEGDEDLLYAGIPLNPPCISVQMQAHGGRGEVTDVDENAEMYQISLNSIVNHLKPQTLLVYGGPRRDEWIDRANLPKSLHVISVENYITARGRWLKDVREAVAVK